MQKTSSSIVNKPIYKSQWLMAYFDFYTRFQFSTCLYLILVNQVEAEIYPQTTPAFS